MISALQSPIKAVHSGVFSTYFHAVSNKSPPMAKPRRHAKLSVCTRFGNGAGVDWSARRQGEKTDRRLAAVPDCMTHVLGRTVVKHTARSLTVFTAVDSGRSWRLGVGRISFISRCSAEPGETRRARQTLALFLLRNRSPSLVS